MSEMNDAYFVEIHDAVWSGTSGAPSDPVLATSVGTVRGALFRWDNVTVDRPQWYKYRTKVGSESWSSWVRTDLSQARVIMTDTETDAQGATPTIQIEVYAENASGTSNTVSDNVAADILKIQATDIPDDTIATCCIDADFEGRIFDDTNMYLSECAEAADAKIMTAAERTSVGYATSHLEATGIQSTAQVDGATTIATIETYATNGDTANTKITNDVGADTIEDVTGSQAKVDARLSSSEKSKLDASVGGAVSTLDGTDTILISGTHETVSGEKATVKGYLDLGNVENYSALNQVENGLSAAKIISKELVTYTNILAKANASAEATKIIKGTIDSVAAETVEDSGGTALFNASGELLDASVIGTGSSTTAADVSNAINSGGDCISIDLTDAGISVTGDLNDFQAVCADGADYKHLTTAKNTQLTNIAAGSGFAATGECLATLSDTVNTITPATVINRTPQYEMVWTDEDMDVTGAAGTGTLRTVANTGALIYWYWFTYVHDGKFATLTLDTYAATLGDALGELYLEVWGKSDLVKELSDTTALDGGVGFYSAAVTVSGLTAGTIYRVRLGVDGTNAKNYGFQGSILYGTRS